ncbi:MAG: HlyD family type I secretion periplasmic adaptor subunit [Rhodospirillaceae bacterium]|nr:HlyD family type I secretion periplasmic adaptor subunit [Rhodospirillaceae bacterium]
MSQELTPWTDPTAIDDVGNPRRWRGMIWLGFTIMFLFFGVFGVWAAFAPLGTGSIAQGQIQVESNRKTIQHLEGGIVRRILARDGDLVRPGQVLVEMDDTRQRVEFDLLEQQYLANLGAIARLNAERLERSELDIPRMLMDRAGEAEVNEIINGERRLFANRRKAMRSERDLLGRRIAKAEEEIVAIRSQLDAESTQLVLIKDEIADVDELLSKGLARKPRLLALQREEAKLVGSLGNRGAMIARAGQTVAETELQRVNLREQRASEIEQELRDTQERLADLLDRMTAAGDALTRAVIVAPTGGRVHGLRVHTEGGVIGPGEPILSIVPRSDELLIIVRIDPIDIDIVRIGSTASVTLTAFSQRTVKPLQGTLIDISADVVTPEGGMPFYEGRITLDAESLANQPDMRLVQGMPAMAIISGDDQTLLEYILAPVTRSFKAALKES